MNTVLQIHFKEESGDILVFLTGQEDIKELTDLLKEKVEKFPKGVPDLKLCPLYAALPPDLQLMAFEPVNPAIERKVIISTNIAETSITLRGVKYVLDSGFVKIKCYLPNKQINML